jgi:hypothetical protein
MRAFVEARGRRGSASGRTGTGVGAHGGRASPFIRIPRVGCPRCRRRPSTLCTVILGLPLKFVPFPPWSRSRCRSSRSSYICRCNISKHNSQQLPRRCILPRPAPVLSFFLFFAFYFPSCICGWWRPGSRMVAGAPCYIAGRSNVWSDVRLCSAYKEFGAAAAAMGKHRTMIVRTTAMDSFWF